MTLKHIATISEIPAQEWDALVGPSAFGSHGWLATVEATLRAPGRPLYITAGDSAGLAGAIPCRVVDSGPHFGFDGVIFNRLAPLAAWLGMSTMPALECGTDAGLAKPVYVRHGIPIAEEEAILHLLVGEAERIAGERNWTLAFRNVAEDELALANVFQERGYLRTREAPTTCLELPWSSFSEYRAHLKKTHPRMYKNVSRERNLAKRNGMQIVLAEDPASYGSQLQLLMELHYMRVGRRPFPFKPGFFEKLKSEMGERADVAVAVIQGEAVGVALRLKSGDVLHVPMVGIDPVRGRAAAAYFNLVYNDSIDYAIRAGFRRLVLGRTNYGLKIRRGCRLLTVNMYVAPRSGYQRRVLACFLPVRSRLMDHKHAVRSK